MAPSPTTVRHGRLIIHGSTNTKSLPLSDRAYSKASKRERDGFISILNSENMEPEYSTLFGGSQFDFVRSAFFLDENRVVLSGETNSPDFLLTENALHSEYPVYDKTFNNTFFGKRRCFVSVLRHFVASILQAPRNLNVQKHLRLVNAPMIISTTGAEGTRCGGRFARGNHEMPRSTY
jgi:hypothetical protein